jgi:hypothetical protein
MRVFLNLALVVCQWSASRLGRFTTGERSPSTQWTVGWVGPRTSLNVVEKNITTNLIHDVLTWAGLIWFRIATNGGLL